MKSMFNETLTIFDDLINIILKEKFFDSLLNLKRFKVFIIIII